MKIALKFIIAFMLAPTAYADSHDLVSKFPRSKVAFTSSTHFLDDQTVQTNFTPAEGYYLYRDKFRFTPTTGVITVGDAVVPAKSIKRDKFFDEIETYRDGISSGSAYILQVTLKGCNDLDTCYPLLKQDPTTSLAALDPAQPDPLSALLTLVDGDTGNDDTQLLEPDRAFSLTVLPIKNDRVVVEWTIADGYYLYHDKFMFSLENSHGIDLGEIDIPSGEIKSDPYFGETEIHRNNLRAQLPLQNLKTTTEAILSITYQGCADLGVCYPPIEKQIPITFTPMSTTVVSNVPGQALVEQDRIAAYLFDGKIWLTLLIFLGLGLLLAFTPCIFPMVPILSSIIVGQSKNISARSAFGLSLVYVLAIAVTYTAAGVAVGLSGENIQIWFQTPWVLLSFAILLVLLSLSMFGFYDLQMPIAWQSRLSGWNHSRQSSSLLGVAVMGFLSALIVSPCITAPLVGALIYIAETGDAILGGAALFALSVGMGIPLLIVGTSAAALLPRVGAWMGTIKSVFGVLLLALAIWMLERILPFAVIMVLSSLLLIVCAVYMGALEPLCEAASAWFRLWKALGLAMLIYGVMLAVGAAVGGTGFLHPLEGVLSNSTTNGASAHIAFKQIKGINELDDALRQASTGRQTAMLDIYADWCISCKEMEILTFSNPVVAQHLKGSVLLQADVTQNDVFDQALLRRIGIFGPPAILFFDRSGREITNSRVIGFMPAERFADHVERIFIN